MIFEDVHWIDPTTLEAVGRTVDRLRTLGVLLIVTYRPEFEPPWIGRPYVSALSLNRLGEREIAAMIDRVTGNKVVSEKIRQDIIERTDGVPLFVEEMTGGAGGGERRGYRARGRRYSLILTGRPSKLARVTNSSARPARPG
jgi:predicted ATPase